MSQTVDLPSDMGMYGFNWYETESKRWKRFPTGREVCSTMGDLFSGGGSGSVQPQLCWTNTPFRFMGWPKRSPNSLRIRMWTSARRRILDASKSRFRELQSTFSTLYYRTYSIFLVSYSRASEFDLVNYRQRPSRTHAAKNPIVFVPARWIQSGSGRAGLVCNPIIIRWERFLLHFVGPLSAAEIKICLEPTAAAAVAAEEDVNVGSDHHDDDKMYINWKTVDL